jgi:vitamin B12 transporter
MLFAIHAKAVRAAQEGVPSASAAYEFNIPAQALCEALQAFARVSRQQVTFDSASLAGATSNELAGRYTAEQALSRLLQGTDVTFRRSSRGVWMIGRSRGAGTPAGTAADASEKPLRLAVARAPVAASAGAAQPEWRSWSAQWPGQEELQELVISASRIPQEWRHTSSSVSVISMGEMKKLQVSDLKSSLAQQPGVNVVTTGTVGGGTSVYIRGAYPHHTLFIVDGVRMNDRSASYDAFLGSASLGGMDRIEVLRGPQSPMYGSAAMGGVIVIDTAEGTKALQAEASATGGSFETASASVAARGSAGALGYSFSLGRFTTQNDLPSNGFESGNYSARLDYALAPRWDLNFTYRGQRGEFESIGSRQFQVRGVVDSANDLGTVKARWRASDSLTSRFTAGFHRREYRWIADSSVSQQVNERKILEWQTAWTPSERGSLVFGANYENSDYDINAALSEDEIVAGFLSGTWLPSRTLTLTAGIRHDRFDTVGSAFTWRAGVAWMAWPDTKLRATYGTGFSAPGSSDRFGVPAWSQLPNPDLRPEKSRGWDAGVDRSFLNGTLTLSTTWFDNRFRDLIDWTYLSARMVEGMFVNRTRASTRGVELGVTAQPASSWHLRLGYTFLEGRDDRTGERLRRRPRHSMDLSSWLDVTDRWTVGLGLRSIDDRVESVGRVESYSVVRAFSSFDLPRGLSLKVRAENLFDERYDEVYGYAALPRGIYGSVEWKY